METKYLLKSMKTKVVKTYARLSYSRKTRLYCVGTAKSGTHSIDSMFDNTVRAQHEPDSEEVIRKILEIAQGRILAADLLSYIRKRDKNLCLDIDSSQLNFFLLDYLLEEFPDALFLLTIRDCYSWLDSFINDSLRRDTTQNWILLREYRFQSNVFSHPLEERVLKEKGLYTLDGYLSYWANHNNKILSSIPEDKLMIVKTHEITQKAHDIAAFAGLSQESIRIEKSHSFKNPQKFNVLREIDQTYLEAKVREYCSPLMNRFFPEIQSLSDAGI